jgi:ATP-dependent DNA helicase RecG
MIEHTQLDKKSILCFADREKVKWNELAKDCVAFANTRGGLLLFGVEDSECEPKSDQVIRHDLVNQVQSRIFQSTTGVALAADIETHPNGGMTLNVKVHPNRQSLASTTNGKYYYRVGDKSVPVLPDMLPRLLAEKDMFVWETQVTGSVPADRFDPLKLNKFLSSIQASERVSSFVKEKSQSEILDHYFFTKNGCLTHLGVLWIGQRNDRAQLRHAPMIQFIKYDAQDRKIRKIAWDDYSMNPLELIEAVWREIPEWREFTEFPDGIFRKAIPHYEEVVIRELLANALVHRPYTTAGDIFINLYPDYLEIHNPGRFPLGVTAQNILHKTVRRNDHLAKDFYDLKLMEREGSGYDRIYEAQLAHAKPVPLPREEDDRVVVKVSRVILKPEILDFLANAEQRMNLGLKERIALGLIAQHVNLTASEFSRLLDLPEEARLREWLGSLLTKGTVITKGKTKGTTYSINPNFLRAAAFSGVTTLKSIEPHRLRELLLTDLSTHSPNSNTSSDILHIHSRIGEEIRRNSIKVVLDQMRADGTVQKIGGGRYSFYHLTESGISLLKHNSLQNEV